MITVGHRSSAVGRRPLNKAHGGADGFRSDGLVKRVLRVMRRRYCLIQNVLFALESKGVCIGLYAVGVRGGFVLALLSDLAEAVVPAADAQLKRSRRVVLDSQPSRGEHVHFPRVRRTVRSPAMPAAGRQGRPTNVLRAERALSPRLEQEEAGCSRQGRQPALLFNRETLGRPHHVVDPPRARRVT